MASPQKDSTAPEIDAENLSPGIRLKAARLKSGFQSVAEAARVHKFHRQNLADHEAGRRRISPEQAQIYASAFDVSASWILFGNREVDIDRTSIARSVPLVGVISNGFQERGSWREIFSYVPIEEERFKGIPLSAYLVVYDREFGVSDAYAIVAPREIVGIRSGDRVVIEETTGNDLLVRHSIRRAWSKPADTPQPDVRPRIVGVIVQMILQRAPEGNALLDDSTLLLK